MFAGKKNWQNKMFDFFKYKPNKMQQEYNAKCRNLILNSRPRFGLIIHDGNIEFTGPPDQPSLNMIEDPDLHNFTNKI